MRARKFEAPFADRVAGVWGGLDELVREADDPVAATAAFFEMTASELRAWRAAEGRHYCQAVTSRGAGCRNPSSDIVDLDPRVWISRGPGFCATHTTPDAAAAPPHAGRSRPPPSASPSRRTREDDGSEAGR